MGLTDQLATFIDISCVLGAKDHFKYDPFCVLLSILRDDQWLPLK